jgi:hypothetical protein
MDENSQGARGEKWVKDFANRYGIISSKQYELEKFVKLLSSQLEYKLIRARPFLRIKFAFSDEWLEALNSNRRIPVSSEEKNSFANELLDLCIATDLVVDLRDNSGEKQTIAIDVATNPDSESKKLATIRGQADPNDKPGFNRNQNVPAVRKALGLNKHLILVVNPDNPPNQEQLLNELYAFANSQAKTRSINLHSPTQEQKQSEQIQTTPNQTPQQLWEYYRQQVPPELHDRPIKVAENAAFRALRNGVDIKQIKTMLVIDPSVQQLAKRQGPEAVERYLTTIVNSAQQQLQGWLAWKKEEPRLTAIATLNYLNQKGQDLVGDGKERILKTGHRLTFQDNVLTIAKGDRNILQADKGQIQFNPQREDQELLQELRRGYGSTQQQGQQQQRRGPWL